MLKPLTEWKRTVTLVPYSGVQFLDFGFNLDDTKRLATQLHRAPRPLADAARRLDPAALHPAHRQRRAGRADPRAAVPRSAVRDQQGQGAGAISEQMGAGAVSPRAARAAAPMGEELLDTGPTNWARALVIPLDPPEGPQAPEPPGRPGVRYRCRPAGREPRLSRAVVRGRQGRAGVPLRLAAGGDELVSRLARARAVRRPGPAEMGRRLADRAVPRVQAGAAPRAGPCARRISLPPRALGALPDPARAARRRDRAAPAQAARHRLARAPLRPGRRRPRARRRQQPDLRHPDRDLPGSGALRPQQQLRAASCATSSGRTRSTPSRSRAGSSSPRPASARSTSRGAPGRAPELLLAEPGAGRPGGAAGRRRGRRHRGHDRHVEPQALSVVARPGQSGVALPARRLHPRRRGPEHRARRAALHQRDRRRDPPDRGRGEDGPQAPAQPTAGRARSAPSSRARRCTAS